MRFPVCADVRYLVMELGQDKELDHFGLCKVLLSNDNNEKSITIENITIKNNVALFLLRFKL
jgi:hypothetical protein